MGVSHAQDWSQTGNSLTKRVLSILGPGEELALGTFVTLEEGPQEVAYFLDLPLRLPVKTGMVTGCKAYGHT